MHVFCLILLLCLFLNGGMARPQPVRTIDAAASTTTSLFSADFDTDFNPNGLNTTDPTSNTLHRRQCVLAAGSDEFFDCDNQWPTMSQMIARIRDTTANGGANPEARVYFYTNMREPTPAERFIPLMRNMNFWIMWTEAWVNKNKIPSYMFSNAASNRWYAAQGNRVKDHWKDMLKTNIRPDYVIHGQEGALEVFTQCFVQAMAMAALHEDAYLFTQKGKDWRPASVWQRVEYWKLTSNPNVKRIYRVDPAPGACDQGEVMWLRGRDEPKEKEWECPVLEL